ncbi:hypothetical protein GCM10023093_13070 [Nemorincola caseinilytica]|uniref:DUF5606 domain-containing protein n=1 Tax=Nemorincola caseinilytica TaxID=2054315 RepID=A0ABP8ND60_9BACT
MEYREIVAVTGLSGLYQLLATKSDGAIVRSVAEKTTKFISARQHNVTPLESIEVYTTGDNVRLQLVFQKMMEQEAAFPPAAVKTNDNGAIKAYFKNIFPEFDEERVYVSDMKKMLKWFEILRANDLLNFEEPAAEEAPAEAAPVAAEAPAAEEAPAEKPAKKAAKKKKADTEEGAGEEAPAEKPAKKAAPKKKKTEE